jgi:hypothetical protein
MGTQDEVRTRVFLSARLLEGFWAELAFAAVVTAGIVLKADHRPQTRDKYRDLLAAVLDYARRQGWIDTNPLAWSGPPHVARRARARVRAGLSARRAPQSARAATEWCPPNQRRLREELAASVGAPVSAHSVVAGERLRPAPSCSCGSAVAAACSPPPTATPIRAKRKHHVRPAAPTSHSGRGRGRSGAIHEKASRAERLCRRSAYQSTYS